MSVGIQEVRLPRDVVNSEIDNIRKAGVEIKTNSPVGRKGIPLEALMRQGFKAVFLAVGTKRKREMKLPGEETVGSAFGEIPDLSFLEGSPLKTSSNNVLETDPHSLTTNINGFFAGGDMINGPTSVIQAIGSGRRAAFSIHKYLSGESLETSETEPSTIGIDAINIGMFRKRGRQKAPRAGAYGEDAALSEADRCFQCGMFPKK